MPATHLVLIRHAQTASNLGGSDAVMSGCFEVPVTDHGVRQAQSLAGRLTLEPPRVVIYSSPLERARRTAAIIAERVPREVSLIPALREIDCGTVDGWPLGKVQECFPREWAQNNEQNDPDFRWPGGESYREFRARILQGLWAIVDRHPSERVMIVTHAGVISQIVRARMGASAARWDRFRPHNTSITELRASGGDLALLRFNDRGESARARIGSAQDA